MFFKYNEDMKEEFTVLSGIASKHNQSFDLDKTMKNYTVNKSDLEFCREQRSEGTTDMTRKHSGVISQMKKHQKVNQHIAFFVDKILLHKKSVYLNSRFSVLVKIMKM